MNFNHPSKCFLNEIFVSIQGEGLFAGTPQLFIRFAGCHLRCIWCDTPYSLSIVKSFNAFYDLSGKNFKQFDNPIDTKNFFSIIDEVIKKNQFAKIIGLTGGEALLQCDFLLETLPYLRKKYKRPILLETSGTLVENLKKVSPFIDIISIDLKLPSSTKEKEFWRIYEDLFEYIKQNLSAKQIYLKVVLTKETLMEEFKKCTNLIARKLGGAYPFFLQPVTPFNKQEPPTINKLVYMFDVARKRLSNVKILPQIHPFMKWK